MEKNKIEVVNLTKQFGDLLVLDHVNFSVKEGEFVCVVGPTGCGKTTFLKLLTRLHEPTSGNLLIDDVLANPQKHDIAFAFQEPSSYPWLNVRQNLEFGLKIKKQPKDVIDSRVNRVLDLLGLRAFESAYPHELSVSAEQRVIIGRAFTTCPDLLLMDEPYGQMDIKMRYYLEDEVLRLWKEFHSTVLFITHNVEEAVYLADRILVLTNKPATIREDFAVDLPRKRDVTSPQFIEIRKHITEMIKWW